MRLHSCTKTQRKPQVLSYFRYVNSLYCMVFVTTFISAWVAPNLLHDEQNTYCTKICYIFYKLLLQIFCNTSTPPLNSSSSLLTSLPLTSFPLYIRAPSSDFGKQSPYLCPPLPSGALFATSGTLTRAENLHTFILSISSLLTTLLFLAPLLLLETLWLLFPLLSSFPLLVIATFLSLSPTS